MQARSLIALCLLAPLLSAETAYRHVDARGNVTFTDQAVAGAEEIRLKRAQTITPPAAGAFKPVAAVKRKAGPVYQRLAIVKPHNDETIVGTQGNFNVQVAITPALRASDKLVLLLNGERVLSAKTATFALKNLDRGAHILQVAISNGQDKLIRRSAGVTVHVKRTAQLAPSLAPDPKILSPLNPPRPKPPPISPTNPPRPKLPAAPEPKS